MHEIEIGRVGDAVPQRGPRSLLDARPADDRQPRRSGDLDDAAGQETQALVGGAKTSGERLYLPLPPTFDTVEEERMHRKVRLAAAFRMFSKAGLSIAMGNASIDVKGRASYVTASNAEDGFALAIERYILNEARELLAGHFAKGGP